MRSTEYPARYRERYRNSMTQSQRILIVRNGADLKRACRALEQRGFTTAVANDCAKAFDQLIGSSFDLVAVNSVPALDAIEFIRRVRATSQLTGILILILAEWGTGEPTLALSAGADAYEPSPIDQSRLITSIERLLCRRVAAANLKTL